MPKVRLNPDETQVAANLLMAAAQAHEQTSKWCLVSPQIKASEIELTYFSAVAFGMILLSIEQSLKLLMILRFQHFERTHNILELYKTVKHRFGDSNGAEILFGMIGRMNILGGQNGFDAITQDELEECLQDHQISYVDLRYFGLDKDLKQVDWEIDLRDNQILQCLAMSLISMNGVEMKKRGWIA